MRSSIFAKYLWLQLIFWTIAYILLTLIVHLVLRSSDPNYRSSIAPNIAGAIVFGIFQGAAFGLTERFLERDILKKQSLVINIAVRAIVYVLNTIIILTFFRQAVYEPIVRAFIHNPSDHENADSWENIFYLIVIYNFMMSLVVIFIAQVGRKFGSGMMFPLLLGHYRIPREEQRVFLFMDMKSSTSIAETLGHLRYSALIRDCILDINLIASKRRAQIYQYVGDEVVLTWDIDSAFTGFDCINFFFDCDRQFERRTAYYDKQYALRPKFKIGGHLGKVTAVEVGEIKRDIAYHGDTLNTAARIQNLCNELNARFLISSELFDYIRHSPFRLDSLGAIHLKGKEAMVEIYAVDVEANSL